MKLAVLFLAAMLAGAQEFEVAAIKRCVNSDAPAGGDPTPGRLHLACVTTANLIRLAYLVFPTGQPNAPVSPTVFQMPISGGPSWIDSDRYSVDAKAEAPVNAEMMKGPMMQRLLEQRFKLRLRRESRQADVFEVSVAKGGFKLEPAKPGGCSPCGVLRRRIKGGFDIRGATIADLCRQLSAYVDREILDKTGVNGVFDIHLEFTPPDAANGDDNGSAIASALKKLGLQIRNAKASTQFLAIDHVERPSEN